MTAAADEAAQPGILAASAPNGVARVDPRSGVRAGSRVSFAVAPERLHCFDPDTGVAIALLGGCPPGRRRKFGCHGRRRCGNLQQVRAGVAG